MHAIICGIFLVITVVLVGCNDAKKNTVSASFDKSQDLSLQIVTGVDAMISATPCFEWRGDGDFLVVVSVFDVEKNSLLAQKKDVNVIDKRVCLDKSWVDHQGNKLEHALPVGHEIFWEISSSDQSFTTVKSRSLVVKANVIIILADDLGWNDVNSGVDNGNNNNVNTSIHSSAPCKGENENCESINSLSSDITAFSQQENAVTFSNAYAHAANCAPSRASLLTGKSPKQHRVYTVASHFVQANDPAYSEPQGYADDLLSSVFKKEGYATALIGKWHLFSGVKMMGEEYTADGPLDSEWRATNRGFDHNWGGNQSGKPLSYGACNGRFYGNIDIAQPPPCSDVIDIAKFPEFLHIYKDQEGKEIVSPLIARDSEDYSDDLGEVLQNIAKQYILAKQKNTATLHRDVSKPFFLYYSLYDPHVPVPAAYDKNNPPLTPFCSDRRDDVNGRYFCMLERVNRRVNGIIDALTGTDTLLPLKDSTYVIFTSDNGIHPMFRDISGFDGAKKLRGAKSELFEGGIKVPLIISGPGVIKALNRDPVTTTDIYNTALGLVGLKTNSALPDSLDISTAIKAMPGESLPSINRGISWYSPVAHFARLSALSTAGFAFRSQNYKLISHFFPHSFNGVNYYPIELYDMSNDFAEQCNLLSHHVLGSERCSEVNVEEVKAIYNDISAKAKRELCGYVDFPMNFLRPLKEGETAPGYTFYAFQLMPEWDSIRYTVEPTFKTPDIASLCDAKH
jgi:arylsulfatase A-like enzyme